MFELGICGKRGGGNREGKGREVLLSRNWLMLLFRVRVRVRVRVGINVVLWICVELEDGRRGGTFGNFILGGGC